MSSSDSDLSDDEYHYEDYRIERYKSGRGPPLIAKKSRILAAATQNDVETLRQLLDCRKWYKVRDKYGIGLFDIALNRQNEEVFDFLRTLPIVEWDMKDLYIVTRFDLVLAIERAADVNAIIDDEGNTLLQKSYTKAIQLLIERGADLNKQDELGKTPLHKCVKMPARFRDEVISMLLYYGADPSIRDRRNRTPFDENLGDFRSNHLLVKIKYFQDVLDVPNSWFCARGWDPANFVPQSGWWGTYAEVLFYLTVDEWSSYEADGWSLLKLAHDFKSAFKHIAELSSDVIYSEFINPYDFSGLRKDHFSSLDLLITLESDCLEILLEKHPSFVKEVLQSYNSKESYSYFNNSLFTYQFDLKKFDVLIQSSLSLDVIELISTLDSSQFVRCLQYIDKSKDEILEIIYYFLSYGMCLHEGALEGIYEMTGYSEDFKNFLHMDVQKQPDTHIRGLMLSLIFDLTLDIHERVKHLNFNFDYSHWQMVFNYFRHPKIQSAYFVAKRRYTGINVKVYQIPSLREIARDAFRKHFIEIFKIKTAKQFYTLLRKLPVGSVYKKIITFETRLY